jgi:hypothetical protein
VAWRGEARRGRAGQAFEFGEPGVVDGATANSLAGPTPSPIETVLDETVALNSRCAFTKPGMRASALQKSGSTSSKPTSTSDGSTGLIGGSCAL